MNIKSLGKDELDEWNFERIKQEEIEADEFVYHYESYDYEGSGFAVWVKDNKWSYHELGHCSCYGPTNDIGKSDKMKVTKEELLKLLSNYYKPMPELISFVENY